MAFYSFCLNGLFGYFVFEAYRVSAPLRLCWNRSNRRNSGCHSGSCGVFEECLRTGDALCEGLGMTLVFGNELDEAKIAAKL